MSPSIDAAAVPIHQAPIHQALGLTDDEFDQITELLGREANHLELAMYAVMWSEHCSYKSSRVHLGRLPSEGEAVLVGPGENAGVVTVGDGIAAAFRIESHNHPSAIEPYQGAATGAGGILRDIFTMGARPIALMDPLRFGPLDDARSRWIAEGVISGISGYGNSVGVPTVGGETVFDPTYLGNPLVNVFCLGLLPEDRLVLGAAEGVGNKAVLFGSATGRDGIGGVSVLASAGFSDDEADAEKRPSVQVGDPYEEKRLIEACLTMLDEGLVVGIQDLGGAGLTCATSETASRAGLGMDVDVSVVHLREEGMEPFETLTSESQERMLAIVTPENLDRVLALCAEWQVATSVIGTVTEGGQLRILDGPDGEVLADVPAATLHDNAPKYNRPMSPPTDLAERQAATPTVPDGFDLADALAAATVDPSWVYRQYDHQLFLNTVVAPGGDAAVLRLKHPTTGVDTGRGLAITTDGNHRWCAVDPDLGTRMVVAEALLNLACVGAKPLALVNCLNFGNPEHEVVMWQLSGAVDGLAHMASTFDVPVIGGNVSLYNESAGTNIDPTPVVAIVGMIDELAIPPGLAPQDGDAVFLVGRPAGDLAGSRLAFSSGQRGGTLAGVDDDAHAALCDTIRQLVIEDRVSALHDISDGGLVAALVEMAAAGSTGVSIDVELSVADLFSESSSRVVLALSAAERGAVVEALNAAGVPFAEIGSWGGDRFALSGHVDLPAAEVTTSWLDALPSTIGVGTTQG